MEEKLFLVITDGYERFEQGQRTVEIKKAVDLETLLKEVLKDEIDEEDEFDIDELESSNGDGSDYVQVYEMNGTELNCVFGEM